MQALPPRATNARVWALQIVPAPPVQNSTLSLKMPSRQVLLRNSSRGIGIVEVGCSCLLEKCFCFQVTLAY
jgi:hypothetical protein